MTFSDAVTFAVTPDDVKAAIAQAQQQHFQDNLRNRHPNIAFDSALRGYIGERVMARWLTDNGIYLSERNTMNHNSGMDVDFRCCGLSVELKTSLIPQTDRTIETAFSRRDIKLICRSDTADIIDLADDIHCQIYFAQRSNDKDRWLEQQIIDLSADSEHIYQQICGKAYVLRPTVFCGWIDKPTLVQRIQALPVNQRTWHFGQRNFWHCPLRDAFAPWQLIDYLLKRQNGRK